MIIKDEVITIRKVILTMEENDKYTTIKKLVEINGNKKRAALKLNCTVRHINRMVKGYQEDGKAYFIHGNHGRKPIHTLEVNKKQLILDLYHTKYTDANITHFSELLIKHEKIMASPYLAHFVQYYVNFIPKIFYSSELLKL